MPRIEMDWLRLTRVTTQYVVPALVAIALIGEIGGMASAGPRSAGAYAYLIAILFSVLTLLMIGVCGWIVFLGYIYRLFCRLECKIDTQASADAGEPDGSLLGRVREMLSNKVKHLRAEAISTIEKAYWEDINAGGVLAFPQPDIARAIERIDESRRDLLSPLSELVARTVPIGGTPAT